MTGHDVSLVIISRNRAEFLERGFRHLVKTGFSGEIFLGDASERSNEAKVADVVEKYSEKLKINTTFYEIASPPITRLRLEFDKVSTNFSAWMGDDDFLVPDALDAAVKQLANDSAAVAAVGKSMLFETANSDAFGSVVGLGPYPQIAYSHASADHRLNAFLVTPTALCGSLRRTSFTQRLHREILSLQLPDDIFGYHFFEIMDAMITAALGKIISIDRLLMVRQAHAKSSSRSGNLFAHWPGFLNSKQWPSIYARCVQTLASALREANPTLGGAADEYAGSAISRCVSRTSLRSLAKDKRPTPHISFRKLTTTYAKRFAPNLYLTLARRNAMNRLSPQDCDQLRTIIATVENCCDQFSIDHIRKITKEQR